MHLSNHPESPRNRTAKRGLWLACLLVASCPALAGTLRLHGSNTLGETLAPALVEAWFAARGCAGIERQPVAPGHLRLVGSGGCDLTVDLQTHGSGTGIAGLLDNRTDLAMASRPVTADEVRIGHERGLGDLASPVQELVVALDGVAVIVHPDNPLRELRVAQVRQLFDGSMRDWSQVGGRPGPVRVHARDDASGTFDTFRGLVLGRQSLRGDAARYESTRDLAAAVAADAGAIGFVGFAGMGRARALAIADAGVAMLPETFRIAVEDYPLSRRLYFYRAADASPLARDFGEFVLSGAMQPLIERIGFVSQDVRAYADTARIDAPAEYRELVKDAQRLNLNFRFGRGLVDSKAARDVERLAQFVAQPENRERRLLLLGFVDGDEVSPYLAHALSNDRVDYIADRLAAAGLPVLRARGMGGSAPLASDSGDAGRHRNRRVEVWIQ
ncbi:substrate-binding domain-containing protein [Xanthomonadaceae bacterium JHOS43]|nr:substrate-binding domain-containing protein [Xanthomonadaceae bacterium JHOS43]MCX7564238.1 substrate-binding domain-containing protein [Xanthomonadaceae bacterium XH05]